MASYRVGGATVTLRGDVVDLVNGLAGPEVSWDTDYESVSGGSTIVGMSIGAAFPLYWTMIMSSS